MQPQAFPYIVPLCEKEIDILYEDDAILIINKPDLLLSMPGKHPENQDSVITRLRKVYPTADLVHRLDLDTSGIMIIPITKQANAHIARQFQQRTVEKSYIAILDGHLENDSGHIELPLARDWSQPVLQKVCYEKGKACNTGYEVLERIKSPLSTKVRFKPITGRRHQLRIHSMAIGHPILGCDLYATDEAFAKAKRLMLHAESIGFEHPLTGERFRRVSHSPF